MVFAYNARTAVEVLALYGGAGVSSPWYITCSDFIGTPVRRETPNRMFMPVFVHILCLSKGAQGRATKGWVGGQTPPLHCSRRLNYIILFSLPNPISERNPTCKNTPPPGIGAMFSPLLPLLCLTNGSNAPPDSAFWCLFRLEGHKSTSHYSIISDRGAQKGFEVHWVAEVAPASLRKPAGSIAYPVRASTWHLLS